MIDIDNLNINFLHQFGLTTIGHYCFVVNDNDEAIHRYKKHYNAKNWYKPKLTSKQYYLNKKPINYNVDLIFGFSGNKQIELMETRSNEDSIFGHFLKEQEGFHHIGFQIRDLDKTIQDFKSKGYSPILTGDFRTKRGSSSKLAFFDTRKDIGVYTEIVEARILGLPLTQNENLLKLGVLLGDCEKIL